MKHLFKSVRFMAFIPLFFMQLQFITADVGPKPSMDFKFIQEFSGQPVTITSGILFECNQSDCQDAKPLEQLGPQGFACKTDGCSALAYGFSNYHRLEIQFSDGITRESNIFTTAQFQSSYEVIIRQTDLLVRPKFNLNFFSPVTYILLCGGCLFGFIIIGIVVVLLVRHVKKK